MKVFVGYDTAAQIASETCIESLKRFIPVSDIVPLITPLLRAQGDYWRPHTGTESTDFTYTRFLVPYLANYEGVAVFCDGDFFWRKSPLDLLKYHDPQYSVQVVKHDLGPENLAPMKMNGKPQVWYPKKNWSSLMMFNCAHEFAQNLNRGLVSTAAPSYLHGFGWSYDIDQSPSLPLSFNHLAGYGYKEPDPHAVHFTDGGPWLGKNYETIEYADEWLTFMKGAKFHV